MATDFSAQLLRDVILDQSMQPDNLGLQSFTLRRDDVMIMSAFDDSTPFQLTDMEKMAIENIRTSGQDVLLQLYDDRVNGSGAQRVRNGTGSSNAARVTPAYFTPVQEGLDMSIVNQAIRQYGSEGADKNRIIREAYMDHMRSELPKIYRVMYERVNAQCVAYLEAQKWALNTTADAGSLYTTFLADAKRVPLADGNTVILQRMSVEAEENNFMKSGRPMLLGGTTARLILMDYAARGLGQDVYLNQFTNWFDPYFSNTITDGSGVNATLYLVYKGGLSLYNRVFDYTAHPEAEDGMLKAGTDIWMEPIMIGRGTSILPEMPPMKIEVKASMSYADNFASYNVDEARIDIVNNWSFVTTFGALRSYDPTAAVSPIIKYELLSS